MKRLFATILSLMLLLCACGPAPEPTAAPDAAPEPTAVPALTEAPEAQCAPTVDPAQTQELSLEQELYRDETCAFTVTETEFNEHLGLRVHVLCENFSDRPLLFSWSGTAVCSVMYDPFWAEEVTAGNKVNSIIDFDTYALAQMGVESADEITFTLTVTDSEEFLDGPLVSSGCVIRPTGKDAGQVVYPEYVHKNGETVITDNETLTFIIENVEDEVSEFFTLNAYVANHTEKDLLICWDGVSVNGFMADPYWTAAVAPGKQAYTQISFYRTDLEAQGIETVENIEFTLLAMDAGDWEAAYLFRETFTYLP